MTTNRQTWTLKMSTHSRNELIDVSAFIARSMRPDLFHDPNNIPYILVPGDNNGGKCMIVEAMMKELLEGYSPNDMKRPNAPKSMFVERWPMYATERYAHAYGTINGTQVMLGFDRITDRYNDEQWDRERDGIKYRSEKSADKRMLIAFQTVADRQKSDGPWPVGAIFSSNGRRSHTSPWIEINLSEGFEPWDRYLRIDICSDILKSCPHFIKFWNNLKKYKKSRSPQIIENRKFIRPGAVDLNGFMHAFNPDLASKTSDTGADILSFLLENGASLGIEQDILADAVIRTANDGELKKTRLLMSWLKNRQEKSVIGKVFRRDENRIILSEAFRDTHYPVKFQEALDAFPSSRKKAQHFLKDDRYAFVHAQIDKRRFKLFKKALELAKEHMTDAGVAQMLSKRYVSKPEQPSILDKLKKAKKFDLIGEIYRNLDRKDFQKTRAAIETFDRNIVCEALVPIEFYEANRIPDLAKIVANIPPEELARHLTLQ